MKNAVLSRQRLWAIPVTESRCLDVEVLDAAVNFGGSVQILFEKPVGGIVRWG